MTIVQTSNLRKTYGAITAVDNLTLEVEKGSVFGILGPNGSGKTTTLAMLLDVVRPTSGSYEWFGDQSGHLHRKKIGAILEKPNFYTYLSAYKNLKTTSMIKEVDFNEIPKVLDQVGLTSRAHSPFRTFSLGMKQRLAIAAALLPDPEVLILDEPTNGLDPQGIADIRRLITDIAAEGKTIILASHLLDEVQKVCSHFAVLRMGKLIHSGPVSVSMGPHHIVEFASHPMDPLVEIVPALPGYISHRRKKDRVEVTCTAEADVRDLVKFIVSQNIIPTHVEVKQIDLEQQFLQIVSDSD